jgi:dTDP-4-amino-4,6-dideoxygalactose transaminase
MSKLAIKGGTPIRKKDSWPIWPIFDDSERNALLEVFDSGKWWYGEKVREFEGKFAEFQDARFGVTCTNGTAALEMALVALGISAGDEVIVPPYSFVATASAVLKVNAIPVFADIELATFNLDPAEVEKSITDRTKAVLPVHFAGLPCDMDALQQIAEKHDISIIEDACHSWGSKWKGKGTGALGSCGAFSFQMSKNITAGEGGILLTDSEKIADTAASYSNCGRGKEAPWYEHFILGDNLRMTELQAAILLAQLDRLQDQVTRRERSAAVLNDGLTRFPGIAVQERDENVTVRSYHLYTFAFDPETWGISRENFIEALSGEGIPVSAGYPIPLYKNPLFRRKGKGPEFCPVSCPYYGKEIDYAGLYLPNVEKACTSSVWLPHSVLLAGPDDMKDIVSAVEKVWNNRNSFA